MEFLNHTLANGLEIVAECNGCAYSTALGFFVKTGARDERDEEAGISHLLEHMAFKGTATRSAWDVNREFDEMGASYNADTSEENTVFYAVVLPEFQDRALALLADILRPALRPEDFQTEKAVVLEEIHMYEDQPPFGAYEKVRAAYYGNHPLGRSVLGTVESISALTVETTRDYLERRYVPGNIVLAAAGRVDFDRLVACAERCCGWWEPRPVSRRIDPATPHEGFQLITKTTATQQYLLRLSDGPSAEDNARYAAILLATILGDGLGSRLYFALVDSGQAETAVISHADHQGAGLMLTYLCCAPENTAANFGQLLEIYRRTETDGIQPAELEQAKNKLSARIVLASERPGARMRAVGSEWIYCRRYRSVEEDLQTVAAVTRDDVAAVLDRYPLCRGTTLTIGPLTDLNASLLEVLHH